MLMVFFGLVAVCAVCFGLGYSVGHRPAAPATAAVPDTPPRAEPKANKPRAETPELTFYKAVKHDHEDAAPAPPVESSPPAVQKSPARTEHPARKPPSPTPPTGTYMVQVAAVSKKEDADALLGALRRKNYSVSEATNLPHDNLYHVQIGPFSDVKQAESARLRLVGDGYNPIVKR
jgi:cell division septation protein DedD